MGRSHTGICLVGCGSSNPAVDGNPGGGSGIAVGYPGDIGIGGDPRVIFADDFESYASAAELTTRWDDAYQNAQLRIATEAPHVFAGGSRSR